MSKASQLEKVEQQEENISELINGREAVKGVRKDVLEYMQRSWEDQSLQTPQSAMFKANKENESDIMDTYCESGPETPEECLDNSEGGLSPINSTESEGLNGSIGDVNQCKIWEEETIKKFEKLLRNIQLFSRAITVYIIYHITVLNLYPSIYTVNKEMNTDEIFEYYYAQHIIPKSLPTSIMDSCFLGCIIFILTYVASRALRANLKEIEKNKLKNYQIKKGRSTYGKKIMICGVAGRVFGISCLLIILVGLTQYVAHESLNTKGLLVPDIWFSLAKDKYKYDDYKGFTSLLAHIILYWTGLSVDFFGFITALRMVFAYVHLFDGVILGIYLCMVVGIGLPLMQEGLLGPKNSCNANDHHWYKFDTREITFFRDESGKIRTGDFRGPTSTNYPPLFYSEYITMDDGVKIAVDVYLPRIRFGYKTLPTVVDITRYNRRMDVHWPFTLFSLWGEPKSVSMNIWSWQITQTFIPNFYAVVVVDTRGTGASTGHRIVDFSENEVDDFRQIIGWIKNQPWSNGKVGVGGISYDGMAAIKTAALSGNNESEGSSEGFRSDSNLVDAVFALSSPMNVIKELIEPGGLICKPLVEDYYSITYSFEQYGSPLLHFLKTIAYYPFKLVVAFLLVIGNVSPVQGYPSIKKQALEMHQKNWDMSKTIKKYKYLDEQVELDDGTLIYAERLGNTEDVAAVLGNKGVNVYLTSGYCDSANSRGVIQFYDALVESASKAYEQYLLEAGNMASKEKPIYKLVLGPWTHSGRASCSPFGKSISCFEPALYYDLVRFMDCALKGICWENQDKNIHFFQVGEEKWYTTDKFPPPDTKYLQFSFEKHGENEKSSIQELSSILGTRFVPLVFQSKKKETRAHSNQSQNNPSGSSSSYIQLKVGDNYFSEYRSRWMIAMHPFRVTVSYNEKGKQLWHAGERLHQKRKSRQHIRFATAPFKADIRLVGSVWLHFSVQLLDGYDAPIYVYLEDISPENEIMYITEGLAQIGHRHVNMTKSALENIPHGSARKVIRPLTRSYYQPLRRIGDESPIQITLEPITWTFFKDHRLAVSITGADTKNFKLHHISQNIKIAKTINIKLDNSFMVKLPVNREDYNTWIELNPEV
ncbi:X-Pro dipeptidyl-peptidase (S15 family) family protein [Cryptosporidium meleagridis]|uniref:X-Pro dipeptidyl-peptidase (S15 family) family protein n=1 Tax=Cryptosporidium meleagridis TaxID=93969 RepID=A0A2P4YW24_9CRYT|nr:X-Pro dipeptidyl-peptidase (S15 family) family protein [Cryptosporidium meleagridis]